MLTVPGARFLVVTRVLILAIAHRCNGHEALRLARMREGAVKIVEKDVEPQEQRPTRVQPVLPNGSAKQISVPAHEINSNKGKDI